MISNNPLECNHTHIHTHHVHIVLVTEYIFSIWTYSPPFALSVLLSLEVQGLFARLEKLRRLKKNYLGYQRSKCFKLTLPTFEFQTNSAHKNLRYKILVSIWAHRNVPSPSIFLVLLFSLWIATFLPNSFVDIPRDVVLLPQSLVVVHSVSHQDIYWFLVFISHNTDSAKI